MIHRYWHGGQLPATEPWVGSTLRGMGPVTDWTDDTLPPEVVAWLDAHAAQVRPTDALRHRANLVRWWILSELGGVWCDHDVIAFQPLDQLPRPFCAAHAGSPCTSVLGFDVGHRVPLVMLDAIAAAPLVGQFRSRDVSGERALRWVIISDVELRPLPFDSLGRAEGKPWAVHLFASASAAAAVGRCRP